MKFFVLDTDSETITSYHSALRNNGKVYSFQSVYVLTGIIGVFGREEDVAIIQWNEETIADGVNYLLATCVMKGIRVMVRSEQAEGENLHAEVVGAVEGILRRELRENDNLRVFGVSKERLSREDNVLIDLKNSFGPIKKGRFEKE